MLEILRSFPKSPSFVPSLSSEGPQGGNVSKLGGKAEGSRMEFFKGKTKNPRRIPINAIKNISPAVGLVPLRLGGTTYRVPVALSKSRQMALAFQWFAESVEKESKEKGIRWSMAFS